jgi:hypothetical protein
MVADSEKIYHWLDENRGKRLFPTPEASELSVRASNGILGGAVLYYNWVFYESYARSMQATFDRHALPSVVFCFRKELLDYFLQSERAKKRAESQSIMGEDVNLDDELLLVSL